MQVRINRSLENILPRIARELGLATSELVNVIVTSWVEKIADSDDLLSILGLSELSSLADIYRKKEERALRRYKSFLRSYRAAYLTRNIDDTKSLLRHAKLQLIAEDNEVKKTLESLLSERNYWAERLKDVQLKIRERLERENKLYSIDELLESPKWLKKR